MAYENYTIRQFSNALFKKDYSIIPKDILDVVYDEYIDTAQLYETEEFQKVSYIHYLNNRVNSIKLAIKIEKECILTFNSPYLPGLQYFKRYGHSLKWKGSIEDMIEQLDAVQAKEEKFISQLKGKIKELTEFRQKKKKGNVTVKLQREAFIRTINSLGKVGFQIDQDRTTVEELALMIRQQNEEFKLK